MSESQTLDSVAAAMKVFATADDPQGIYAVARLTGVTYHGAYTWLQRNSFPADTYMTLWPALSAHGKVAPLELWKWRTPTREGAPS